jgi:hypothetical protein
MQKIMNEISRCESLLRINSPLSKQKGKSAQAIAEEIKRVEELLE